MSRILTVSCRIWQPPSPMCYSELAARVVALRGEAYWAGLLGLLARPRAPQCFKRECEKTFIPSFWMHVQESQHHGNGLTGDPSARGAL
jgi:hypothetical protein